VIEGRKSVGRGLFVLSTVRSSIILAARGTIENAPSSYVRMKFETYQAAAHLIDQ
jgi:hypothetical protein